MKEPGFGIINFSVFLTSFSILSYEIVFTRIFAYIQWHNLSSLIITMALLGFGASGSIIAVLQKRIETNYLNWFFAMLNLFPLFLALGFILSSFLSFNPYEMSFNPVQVLYIFLYFFLMSISFFFGATIICIALLRYSISKTYFMNLVGSGTGALAVVGALFLMHPFDIMVGIIIVSLVPPMVMAVKGGKKYILWSSSMAVVILAALFVAQSYEGFKKVSEYKPISGALNLPEAKIIHEAFSPLSVVQVVEAKGLRSTAGLSLKSPFQVPVQTGIFFNGSSMSSITPYNGNKDNIGYVQYVTSYLPFYVLDKNRRNNILIIGSGGGESILKSVLSQFKNIDAVEIDQNVISLMKTRFAAYSGNIYNKENVNVIHHDGRSFIKQTDKTYDLIELSMMDTYNAASSGVYALNESYLYTVESIKEYHDHLSDSGVLAISRWVMTPARDNIKIFNIVITALRQMGIKDVNNHLIAIRSLQTLTLIVSKGPAPGDMINQAKLFSKERLFDLVHYPGINEKEVNRFIKLKTPVYYDALQKLLSNGSGSFISKYDFDITAATDNRPYFYNFFKPKVLKLIKEYGPSQIPITEWGYLVLLIILIPVLAISFIFIILPLWNKKIQKKQKMIFAYFSLIGMGYFFIEMVLIQKMILFLGHQAYSLSVIIAGLLIFTGIGSLFSKKVFPANRRIPMATLLIVLITGLYLIFMDQVFAVFISKGMGFKVLIVLLMLAPQGFFMGFPFPLGLSAIKQAQNASLPWAWSINGFFSVISILTASILSIIFGFRAVLIIAILCYFAAGILSVGFNQKQ